METVTTAGSGAAITAPYWLPTLNQEVQFVVAVLGGLWLATQIITKIYTTFIRKDPNVA